MKIPKKVNIGGHDYAIRIVPQEKLHPAHAGECDFEKKEIRIWKELDKATRHRVLLHEIRHAHHHETGLMQVLQAQAMEMDCDAFASLLLSLKNQRII